MKTSVALALLTLGLAASAQPTAPAQTLYRASEARTSTGPSDRFTGQVQVRPVFPANSTAHYSGAYVTFQPGARSHWHNHPAGQHLIITEGRARTGTRDGKVQELQAGDAVWCPPGVDHWHGAAPDTEMTHFVVTAQKADQTVQWKEAVTDAQYGGKP